MAVVGSAGQGDQGCAGDCEVGQFSLDAGELWTGFTGNVLAMAIASDATWIASASDDGTVRLWDVASGTQRVRISAHANQVWAVAISPDSTWIASASADGTVRLWDATSGAQLIKPANHTAKKSASAATTGRGGRAPLGATIMRAWDTTQRAEITGATGAVWDVRIAPDGTRLACIDDDRTLRSWDSDYGELPARRDE
ncbi:WD40 repeat domain-containing protein [Micromonospora sp. CPCC 206061]|uniref:WD40 repeat domain-containing protein n=1 Tax=Micromonospora sp. CPCC 206061 TaxID=3122410 RepID=UPI002FEF843C